MFRVPTHSNINIPFLKSSIYKGHYLKIVYKLRSFSQPHYKIYLHLEDLEIYFTFIFAL